MSQSAAVAAINFALATDEGLEFLRCWNEGNFSAIRKEWPDAPKAVFVGADPLHEETKQQFKLLELSQRALNALHECMLRQRYYGGRSLSEKGKRYLYDLADAAHNLPLALSESAGYSVADASFPQNVELLEELAKDVIPNQEFLKL